MIQNEFGSRFFFCLLIIIYQILQYIFRGYMFSHYVLLPPYTVKCPRPPPDGYVFTCQVTIFISFFLHEEVKSEPVSLPSNNHYSYLFQISLNPETFSWSLRYETWTQKCDLLVAFRLWSSVLSPSRQAKSQQFATG